MVQKKRFTREFKISILQELETKPLSVVCRENNLVMSTVSTWKKDFLENPKEAFKGKGNVWKEDEKIEEYERLIGRLYAEIDFLKKVYEIQKQHQVEACLKERLDIK